MTYRGYRARVSKGRPRWMAGKHGAPAEHYHLITLHFETSAVPYAWLEPLVVIGRGALTQGGVSYHVFAVR
jgi:hypothetical protein